MGIQDHVQKIQEKVLEGRDISFEEALSLAKITKYEDLLKLFTAANKVKEKFRNDKVDLCALTNAKSGSCSEDCAFCAQSAHNKTEVKTYSLIDVEEILKHAEKAVVNKAHRFCIVTSGCTINEEELGEICTAIRAIKNKFPHLKMDAS